MDSLSELSDDELLARHRQRDIVALGELLKRYMPLIYKSAARYQEIIDFDDLVQEGCIGFLDAVRSFRPETLTMFIAFASVCVKNRIRKAVEKGTSKKAGILRNSVPLEEAADSTDHLTPEKIFQDKEDLAAEMEGVYTALSPLERKILFFSLNGYEYKAIASALDIPLKSVDNALQRVRRKLKNLRLS